MDVFRSCLLGFMEDEQRHVKEGRDDDISVAVNGSKTGKEMNMSEQEIISNLFVYAFAGYNTTAIALTNLLIHLAANPES
jgi:cytochrome P450